MKHSQFIEKMAKYKGTKLGGNYWERHKDDPQLPEYGDLSHKSVLDASFFVRMTDMDTLRSELIKHFCVDAQSAVMPPSKIPKSVAIRILEKSGLEWFIYKDKPRVHWKHLPP